MLTDRELSNLTPREKPYKVADRDGMYAFVTKTGTVSFRLDYRLNGRRETLAIGRYDPTCKATRDPEALEFGMSVSLREARTLLDRARRDVERGVSPSRAKAETGEARIITKQALLIPIRDAKKRIHSLQAIFPRKLMGDRDKDYLTGGNKAGHFYSIGKPIESEGRIVIIICEGYATGASLHEATGHAVIVAFDAPNLLPVAQSIRVRFPDAIIIMAADNDQWTLKPVNNPGVTRAREAAQAVGGLLAVPPFEHADGEQDEEGKWSGPNDFNDLHLLEGADAVRRAIDDTLEQAHANRVVLLPSHEDALGAAYAEECLRRMEAIVAERDGEQPSRPALFVAHDGEIERAAALVSKACPGARLHILAAHGDRAEAQRVAALHGASVDVAPAGACWGERLVDRLFEFIDARAETDAASAGLAAGVVARASVGQLVANDNILRPSNSFEALELLARHGIALAVNSRQEPYPNLDNAIAVLQGHPRFAGRIWYDNFHQEILTNWDCEEPRQWVDADRLRVATVFQRDFGLAKFGDEVVEKAAIAVAHADQRDELRDWLKSLRWDGTPRLDVWLQHAVGSPAEACHQSSAPRGVRRHN